MVKTKKIFYLSLFFLTVLGIFIFGTNTGISAADAADASVQKELIAGGMPFGMKIGVGGCIVVGTDNVGQAKSPAAEAGIRRGDIITQVDGNAVGTSRELIASVRGGGDAIDVTFVRGGREKHAKITPIRSDDGEKRIGVVVRDSAAGIGTVTFIDPDTMTFAGLGHGICDAESGSLLPLSYGSVEEVRLTGINPGVSGTPGEIRGAFTGRRIGKISKNDITGVYGELYELPPQAGERYKTASAEEVVDGRAYIRSTVLGAPELYEIEIAKIGNGAQKNFAVKVVDERLLSSTGGIVQGMSGSPIIQNGKLIGAVTHVLVGDPASGYGIFIGNMQSGLEAVDIYEDSAA